MRIIDPFELRARPGLLQELRDHPGEHVERRFAPLRSTEVRAAETDGGVRMGGLAAVFEELSLNLGGFRERIDRGAFRKVLATGPDVRALFNHDINYPLARTTVDEGPGSLRLKEVPKGLDYDCEPTGTTYANDLRINMEAGVVTQSSFAFRVAQGGDTWEEDEETGALIRTIHEFSDLYDVSPVTDPAYPAATAGVRSGDTTSEQTTQPTARANAQEPAVAGVSAGAEDMETPAQGDQAYLVAARQRQLRLHQLTAGRR